MTEKEKKEVTKRNKIGLEPEHTVAFTSSLVLMSLLFPLNTNDFVPKSLIKLQRSGDKERCGMGWNGGQRLEAVSCCWKSQVMNQSKSLVRAVT